MMRRVIVSALLFVFTAGFLLAGDLSGTWTGTMTVGDNQFPLTYKFKQDGATLSGSVTGPGGEIPLAEGKVNGEKVSFSVTVDMGGTQAKYVSEGTWKGEQISLTTQGANMPSSTITLKRAP